MYKKWSKRPGAPLGFWMGLPLIPLGMHLIRRPKLLNPFVWHYGLALNLGGMLTFFDLRPGEKPHPISFEAFAEGRPVYLMKSITGWSELQAAQGRLQHALAHMTDWTLFDNNCEHFAEYVMTGVKKSEQIDSLKWAAGFVVLFLVLGKAAG